MTTPLSHRLRSDTKDAHTAAERSGVMRSLLRGKISREKYVALLQNLAALYEALESELDLHREHVALRQVDWNSLRRFPSLQHDIAAFGEFQTADIKPSTLAYVAHLHEIGAASPGLLFAHAYLRYLGDLYGGQIIKRVVEQTFADVKGATTFYEFTNLGDLGAFKVSFREAIDAIPESAAGADALVNEAKRGYELHAQIFSELEPGVPTE
ncbi:MAG: biliverdin-producing heme oxygenase [Gemmatimonadaceae bacterium]